MKKKIFASLLALSVSLGAMPAFAAENETAVWYNNQEMTIAQPVVDPEYGFTLLPLRGVGELIGAEIGFDGATDKITVTHKGRRVEFGMRDREAIVIEDGQPESLVYLYDTKVVNNRYYVDEYTLSEILGIQVGWDKMAQAIYAVDVSKYMEKLFAETPELNEYFTVFSETPAKYTSKASMELRFDLQADITGQGMQAMNIAITMDEDVQATEEAQKSAVVLDLEEFNLPAEFGVEGVDFSKLRDIKIDMIVDKTGAYYIQTDLMEKLAAAMPNEEELQTAAGFVTSGTWLKIDLSEMIVQLGLSDLLNMQGVDAAKQMMERVLTEMSNISVYSVESAKEIDDIFAAYKIIFRAPYFEVTGTAEEGYQFTLDLNKETMQAMLQEIAAVVGEEIDVAEMDELPSTFKIYAHATMAPDKTMQSEATMEIAQEMGAEAIRLTIKSNSLLTPDPDGEAISMPAVFIDLMQIGEMLNM